MMPATSYGYAAIGEMPWRLWQLGEGKRVALGWLTDLAGAQAIVRGPVIQRYSKAPDHDYDAGTRRRLRE